MVDMVTLQKEEVICVVQAHRNFMFVLTIALTLAVGLAHKTGMLKIWQGSGSGRFETFPAKYQVKWTCIYA